MLGIRRRWFIGARRPQKPRSTTRRQGLRKLSPDLIGKARDETATQVTRIGLTFLGTAAFCLLSLFSPDSALLGSEKISVPLAGPVSFSGFMLLGPAILITLRAYLQIYVEHSDRLDRLARSVSVVRAPTLVPLRNPLIWVLSGLTFYLLLPVAVMLFAWRAAVLPTLGSGLLCVATGVVVSHVLLPFSRFSWWRSKLPLSISAAIISAAIIAGAVRLGFEPPRRPFDLYHANLSGQWLVRNDLRNANLSLANLSGADLFNASLRGADLNNANLIGADLSEANLRDANLSEAKLKDATLRKADLSKANLIGADLNGANLSVAKLSDAYLTYADLSGADLSLANLRGADLSEHAPLSGANQSGADLSEADLRDANLSGADLSDVKNLTQTQLDKACGNANTKLPKELTLKPCV